MGGTEDIFESETLSPLPAYDVAAEQDALIKFSAESFEYQVKKGNTGGYEDEIY